MLTVIGQLVAYVRFMKSLLWGLMTDASLFPIFHTPILVPLLYLELIFKITIGLAALTFLILLPGKSWSFLKWVRVYLVGGANYQVAQVIGSLPAVVSGGQAHQQQGP